MPTKFNGAYTRGLLLYNTINECNIDLKCYLLIEWWGMIDDGHSLFNANDVEEWLSHVKVNLDLSGLNFDGEGFTRGLRERTVNAKNPILIIGKVHKSKILGGFDDRQEFELLCEEVVILEKRMTWGRGCCQC